MNRKKGVHFDNDPLMLRIELTKVDKPEHKIDFILPKIRIKLARWYSQNSVLTYTATNLSNSYSNDSIHNR
jgi:hypothetical protein